MTTTELPPVPAVPDAVERDEERVLALAQVLEWHVPHVARDRDHSLVRLDACLPCDPGRVDDLDPGADVVREVEERLVGVCLVEQHPPHRSRLREEQLPHRPMRLVDRAVGIGGGPGIGIGDGDPPEPAPTDLVRRLARWVVRIEQPVVFIGIAMWPSVHRDPEYVARGLEPAGAEHPLQLAAHFQLEALEGHRQ